MQPKILAKAAPMPADVFDYFFFKLIQRPLAVVVVALLRLLRLIASCGGCGGCG
jgi:hypothetical protein